MEKVQTIKSPIKNAPTNNKLLNIFKIAGTFSAVILLLLGIYITWKAIEYKDVVATVGDIKVTKQNITRQSELDKKMGDYLKDSNFNMGKTSEDTVTEAALLRAAAKDNKIIVTDKEIENSVQELADRSYSGSLEALYRGHLELLGLNKDEVDRNHETFLYKEKIKNLISTHSGQYIAIKTDTANSSDEIAKKTIDEIKVKLDSGESLDAVYKEYESKIPGAINKGDFEEASSYSLSAAGVELNHYSGVASVDNEYVVVYLKQESKKRFETYEELIKYYKDNEYKTSITDKLLSDILFVGKALALSCGCDGPECKKWDPYTVTKCDTTTWVSYPVTACGPSASCALDTCHAPTSSYIPNNYMQGYMCDFSESTGSAVYGCKKVTVPNGTPNVFKGSACANKCVLPVNPKLTKACGLDITLIIDHSGSISNNNLNKVISAFKSFVNSLKDTPTNFSVIDFSTKASIIQNFTDDTDVVNKALESIKSKGAGGTNWLAAFESSIALFDDTDRYNSKDISKVLERPGYQNLVIIATDGLPTYPCGDGGTPNNTDVIEATKAANILKNVPARIVSFGINNNNMDISNLKLISGPIVNGADIIDTDVITTDFDGLATKLHEYASESCQGTVTLKKEVDGIGVKDWEYSVDGKTVKTGDDGMVNVPVGLKKFSITEVPKSGYGLHSASCTGAVENGKSDINKSRITDILVSASTLGTVCSFTSTAPSSCKIKSFGFNPSSTVGTLGTPILSVEMENSKSGQIDFGNGATTMNTPNLNGTTTLTPAYSSNGVFVATATCVGSDGVSHSDNAIFQLQDVPSSGSCSFQIPPNDKILSSPSVTGTVNQKAKDIGNHLNIVFSANLTGIKNNGFISWELWHEGTMIKGIPGEPVNNPSTVLAFAGTDQDDGAWGAGTYKLVLRASEGIDRYGNAVGNCGSVIDFTIDHGPECMCTITPQKIGIAPQPITVNVSADASFYTGEMSLIVNNKPEAAFTLSLDDIVDGYFTGKYTTTLKSVGQYYIAVRAKRVPSVDDAIAPEIISCEDPSDLAKSCITGTCNYTVTNSAGGGATGEIAP